jgi:hypothetical protein
VELIFKNNFDIINLTIFRVGQLLSSGKKQNLEEKNLVSNYTLSYLNESRNWIEKNGKKIELSEKSIILKNQENEIISVMG